MTLGEQARRLQEYIYRDAEILKIETGIEFRTAFKQRSGKLSHVVMPSDLIRK